MPAKCRYDKSRCLEALKWSYGMTTKEAEEFYREAEPETLEAIVDGYERNASKSFYCD